MVRVLSVLTLTASVLAAFTRGDEPTESDLKKKPITTDTGEVGKLLSRWHKEGTAAGNVGDWYDNRDGEHSPLDLRPWPQLQKVKYTEGDFRARRHWALMTRARPRRLRQFVHVGAAGAFRQQTAAGPWAVRC